jgi:hypothetical protein
MKQTDAAGRPSRRGPATLPPLALLAVLTLTAPAAAQQWATAGNGADIYNTNTSTAKVGVGTAAPSYVFHVEGASTDTNNYVQGYFKNTSALRPYGGLGVDGQSQSHVRFLLGGAPKWQWRVGAGAALDDLRAYNWALGRDVLTLKNSGNVGVGTSAPMSLLHVDGGSAIGTMRVSGAGMGVMNFEDTAAPSNQRLYQWRSQGGAFRMTLLNDSGGDVLPNILVANPSGNVGVGTGSPDKLFTVEGQAPALGVMAVVRTTGAANGYGLALDAAGAGNNNFAFTAGGAMKGSVGYDRSRNFLGLVNAAYSSYDFALRLNVDGSLTYHDSSPTGGERLRVTAAGGVGIGTAPAAGYKLDVAGSARVSSDFSAGGAITGGSIQATYQDVAEWVPSTQRLSAGTVVVLDTQNSNHVLASTTAYDTRVAGVVSEQPGVLLGVGGEGKVKVATTGRVKVRVDATRAPVRIGDLIVTSDVEGLAMRSEPVLLGGRQFHAPGTIIGKALEPLEKGTGEILVLLSLQ